MFKFILSLFLFLQFACSENKPEVPADLPEPKLFRIMVVDQLEAKENPEIKSVLKEFDALFGRIEKALNKKFTNLKFENYEDTTLEKFFDGIESLNISKNDTVFFFYIGHGINKPRGDCKEVECTFPFLRIGKEGSNKKFVVNLHQVYQVLTNYEPRFLFAASNAVNPIFDSQEVILINSTPDKDLKKLFKEKRWFNPKQIYDKALPKLIEKDFDADIVKSYLIDSSGHFLVNSSTRFQRRWSETIDLRFTRRLIFSINNVLTSGTETWKELIYLITARLQNDSTRYKFDRTPYMGEIEKLKK